MLAWDDGSGPALFVAGRFYKIGDQTVRYVARWDGKSWSAMDKGLNNYPAETVILALAVHDDGAGPSLYAGGYFTKSGDLSTPMTGVARWDGHKWHAVGGPMSSRGLTAWIHSLASFDDGAGPALYAGGAVDLAEGKSVTGIIKWDGAAWSAVGEPLQGFLGDPLVRAMTAFDDGTGAALWVAGEFKAPGVDAERLARWRHGRWESAGKLFPHGKQQLNEVRRFEVIDAGQGPALYAMGQFETDPTPPGDVTGGCLARWDGAAQRWIDLDANPTVKALALYDQGDGPRLWAGGPFGNPGGQPAAIVATLGADGWRRVGKVGITDGATLAVFDDGSGPAVYVAGSFDSLGDQSGFGGIARYTAAGWSHVGDWADIDGSDSGTLHFIKVLDDGNGPNLYVSGDLKKEGKTTFFGVMRWDGKHWYKVGPAVPYLRYPFMYDAGHGPVVNFFSDIAAEIYRLEDGKWTRWAVGKMGETMTGFAAALEFDDGSGPALWVGGDMTEVEGVPVGSIARFRPDSGWEAVPGFDGAVTKLVVWNDGSGPALYAGGRFTKAGGKSANRAARWDGASWHPLGSGLQGGNGASANLFSWDDGSGPALYASGVFSSAGGVPASNIAKWNGVEWSALGTGLGNAGGTVAGADLGNGPTLFVTGDFVYAGGYPSPGFAAWVPCPPVPCPIDLDGNGSLDLFDFLSFLNLFNAQDPAADCDADGEFSLSDFACYSALFAAGCP